MILGTSIKHGDLLVFTRLFKNIFAFETTQACHMTLLLFGFSKKVYLQLIYHNFFNWYYNIKCGKSYAIFVFLKYQIIYKNKQLPIYK